MYINITIVITITGCVIRAHVVFCFFLLGQRARLKQLVQFSLARPFVVVVVVALKPPAVAAFELSGDDATTTIRHLISWEVRAGPNPVISAS